MVKTVNSILPVYVVAHEFSAMDDTIYIFKIIMNKSFIKIIIIFYKYIIFYFLILIKSSNVNP
jgi:hypothetical protein